MVPVLLAGTVGAVIGALRRPHGAHLETPPLVRLRLVAGAVALSVAIGVAELPLEGLLFSVSLGLLTWFALRNRHLVGMGVLAVGLLCNLTAVALHGGMPVRATALVESGAFEADELADADLGAGRRFERTGDLAPILGDIIPVSAVGAAMSFGDLIALAGIGAVAGDLARLARRGTKWSVRNLFPPELLGKLRAFVEQTRVIDVRTDREVLGDAGHVVHTNERIGGGPGQRPHGGQRPRIPIQG